MNLSNAPVHRAADARFFQKNFATVFSIFDRAFGTYRVPGPCTSPLGVTDKMVASLAGQLGYAFKPSSYGRLFFPRRTVTRQKAGRAVNRTEAPRAPAHSKDSFDGLQ